MIYHVWGGALERRQMAGNTEEARGRLDSIWRDYEMTDTNRSRTIIATQEITSVEADVAKL